LAVSPAGARAAGSADSGRALAEHLGTAAQDKRVTMLTRALAYDYSLRTRARDSLVVALIYKPGSPTSEAAADSLFKSFKALNGVKVQGFSPAAVKMPFESAESLKAAVSAQGVDVVMVCEGLDAEVVAVREVCRALKVMSVGEKLSYVEAGLTIGVIEAGGKPGMVVNLGAAAAENVSFSSELLKLAKVIR
jgi:hypothetical protein